MRNDFSLLSLFFLFYGCKANTLPILMHQMRISTTKVSSVDHFHLLMMCISPMQLIPYAKACYAYEDILKSDKQLTKRFMVRRYNESCLESSFHKFYGCYNDLVCDYKLSPSHMLNDFFSYLLLDCRFHTGFDDG
jgi:hypothetical protein